MVAKKKQALGKGLGALLPSIEFSEKGFKFKDDAKEKRDKSDIFDLVDLTDIRQNPYQPRKQFDPEALEDLKNSIIRNGVIQPVTVRRTVDGYELISGERRFRASKAAGLKNIPAYILEVETGEKMLELALLENLERSDLNPIEVANGYQRLIDECNLTQEQVAIKMGKDRSTITNFLRLLKLPELIQDELRSKKLSMGHARSLLSLNDKQAITKAWQHIQNQALSVRATESMVRDLLAGKEVFGKSEEATKPKPQPKNNKPHLDAKDALVLNDLENKLRQGFGTQVRIHTKSKESGKFEFEFYSKDDFDRLMELFTIISKDRK